MYIEDIQAMTIEEIDLYEEYKIKKLEEEMKKVRYLVPWYADAYSEIARQIMIYGYVVFPDEVEEILEDKMLCIP